MGRTTRGTLMESSFLFRAKNAFHNAAAKAERILTEIKEDLKTDFGRSTTTTMRSDDINDELRWSVNPEAVELFQEKLYECILDMSKDPEKSCLLLIKDENDVGALEDDKALQNLRFDYVPKEMEEQEFWKYYFLAVNRLRRSVTHGKLVAVVDSKAQVQADVESPKKDPVEEDAYSKAMSVVAVPSSKLMRRLAGAIDVARPLSKMKDLELVRVEKDASQSGALVSGLTAMKNSLLRESKDSTKGPRNEDIQACLRLLFERAWCPDNQGNDIQRFKGAYLSKVPEEIHGAPPGSLVSDLAEIISGLGTYRGMSDFWYKLISELRRYWEEGQPIPKLSMDSNPDLRFCLVLQKLQVINCCIARQKRQFADVEFLDALSDCAKSMAPLNTGDMDSFISVLRAQVSEEHEQKLEPARLFARGKDGQVLLRFGADCPAPNLKMLETGQQVYSPLMQEGPVLTEDFIEETEKLVLRTGSVGAGCSQLLSDMQAFKAANPGCLLEDFVRWYSPPDWKQSPISAATIKKLDQEAGSLGYLSARMQSHGNLWQELWASAKAIPAAKQAPLFDEDLAVENTLNELEDIAPAELLEQLFKSILGAGFAIAESASIMKNELVSAQFKECKDFIISTCNKGMGAEELEHLVEVYEMMEIMLQYPEEQQQDSRASGPPKERESVGTISMLAERGSRYYSNLIGNERRVLWRSFNNEQKSCNHPQGFNLLTRILEAKSSLFEKKLSQERADEKGTDVPRE